MSREYWDREQLRARRGPTHPVVAEYVRQKIRLISDHIPLNRNTTVLDLGCGNGHFTHYFDRICNVFCIDLSHVMLANNPSKKKCVMNAENLAFPGNTFDVVFCHALLHHVDNVDHVIREAARVAKKHIIFVEPNRRNPLVFMFSLLVKEERQGLRFSPRYLKNLVLRNGLRIVKDCSHGLLVPNKVPTFLLPVLKRLNFTQPWGITNIVIAEKILV